LPGVMARSEQNKECFKAADFILGVNHKEMPAEQKQAAMV